MPGLFYIDALPDSGELAVVDGDEGFHAATVRRIRPREELVLGDAFSDPNGGGFPQVLWVIGFLTALLTGFYTGRMWWIAFWRPPSPERPVEHPHEAPRVMMVPVVILTVLTCVGGLLQINAGG